MPDDDNGEEENKKLSADAGHTIEAPVLLPAVKAATTVSPAKAPKRPLVFELHGNQLEMRAADRAKKKFKWKNMDYI